jgi:tetraacyldisaccharide 4'-kinase
MSPSMSISMPMSMPMPTDRATAAFLSPWAAALAPLSRVYAAVARARRRRLRERARRLPAPVVSVGNITVGGTGKTPVVELIVRELGRLGRRPAILSRGYGRAADRERRGEHAVNDEYLVLERNLPGVLHVQRPDRFEGGREAIAAGADALVLDDGFQHVRLQRDLDVVLVDAINPFGFGRVLPAGLLREPLDALGEADVIAITRGELVSPRKLAVLRWYLRGRFPRARLIEVDFRPVSWRRLDGEPGEPLRAHAGAPALAFAGIGNPEGFRRQLGRLGVRIVKWIPFLDHHRYTRDDIEGIAREATAVGAAVILLTQKDAVKIAGQGTAGAPWRYLEIEPVVTRGGELLRARLEELFRDA